MIAVVTEQNRSQHYTDERTKILFICIASFFCLLERTGHAILNDRNANQSELQVNTSPVDSGLYFWSRASCICHVASPCGQ